jgi:hypothetical protein
MRPIFYSLVIAITVTSCTSKEYSLEDTTWDVVSLTLDSTSRLNEREKEGFNLFITTTKIREHFFNDTCYVSINGEVYDTTKYRINKDTLFFETFPFDTSIIIKLSKDSLITHSLQGINSRSFRIRN